MKNESGITLIEIMVVVSIISILAVAFGFEFSGWRGRYLAESETRDLYNDMMKARELAMTRNRIHFLTVTGNSINVYEDSNPLPDGDGWLQTALDRRARGFSVSKNIEYPLCTPSGYSMPLVLNKRGLISFNSGILPLTGTAFRIDPDRNCTDALHDGQKANADYDCIQITETRIKMGKWNGTCEVK